MAAWPGVAEWQPCLFGGVAIERAVGGGDWERHGGPSGLVGDGLADSGLPASGGQPEQHRGDDPSGVAVGSGAAAGRSEGPRSALEAPPWAVGSGRAAATTAGPRPGGGPGRGAAGEAVPRPGELPAKPDSLERLPCLPRRFGGSPAWEWYAAWCLLALHDASLILDRAADEVRSQPLCPVW